MKAMLFCGEAKLTGASAPVSTWDFFVAQLSDVPAWPFKTILGGPLPGSQALLLVTEESAFRVAAEPRLWNWIPREAHLAPSWATLRSTWKQSSSLTTTPRIELYLPLHFKSCFHSFTLKMLFSLFYHFNGFILSKVEKPLERWGRNSMNNTMQMIVTQLMQLFYGWVDQLPWVIYSYQ